MRRPVDSPFSPGSDAVPQIWAGRIEQIADWKAVVRPRRSAGVIERGRTILGEPGTGKSSLVRKIMKDAAVRGDWVTPQLRIPSGTDPLKRLAEALLDLARTAGLSAARDKAAGRLLERVEKVAAYGVSLSLQKAEDAPEPYSALTDLLIEIGREAMRQDTVAIVHLDEIQNVSDDAVRSQLLIALGDALVHEEVIQAPGGFPVERVLPLAVYLTGLPEFGDMAGARSGATFARRFKTDTLEALSDCDLLLALHPFVAQGWDTANDSGDVQKVFMEPAAQRAIVQLSCGEPFLFQLAGERAWYAGTGDTIRVDEVLRGWQGASREAETHVQRILERLPARERQFVDAMVSLPEEDRTLTRIAQEMGYAKAADAGPTAQRLDNWRGIIRRGKPYTFRHRAIEAMLSTDWPFVDEVEQLPAFTG